MKHYDNFDDDIISIGWLVIGWTLFVLCMTAFIVMELAYG